MTTNVRTGLADLRKELESPKSDLEKCKKLLVQLKVSSLLVHAFRAGVPLPDSWGCARSLQRWRIVEAPDLINC